MTGFIFAKQGKIKKAEQAYHSALNEQINTEEAKLILQMKLDDLEKI